ncbi:hypothetical protein C8F04DRAFT_1265537 [Mycena alexandri]|uniref:Uncharacterized protein n=1 Tax=Mycena alexandri TaxID=1745969 RepID=A0AAD6SJW9_9AGAR|nr:hypothetical protein C8F04DRAFT_1265537 [Mycena alexandri]
MRGKRAEYLYTELEGYCNASAAGATREWYPKFFAMYWVKFPWAIPFNQDPPDDVKEDTRADSSLSDDEKAGKKKIVKDTEAKIKRWFNYQCTHSGNAVNPWSKWIRSQLKPVEEEHRPRRLHDYQVYMQDEGKNAAINAEDRA